jgi:hypothetical protein
MVPVAAAVLCVVFVAAPRALAAPAPKPAHGKHAYEKQVQALEEQWRQAQLSGNTASIERLLDDDYIGITANGIINTRDQQLERMRNRTLMVSRMDVSDVKVKLIHGIAIVTSRVDLEGTNDGVSVTGIYRYTRIYRRLPNGTWKVTNFEATRINPDAQPGRPGAPRTPRNQPRTP